MGSIEDGFIECVMMLVEPNTEPSRYSTFYTGEEGEEAKGD